MSRALHALRHRRCFSMHHPSDVTTAIHFCIPYLGPSSVWLVQLDEDGWGVEWHEIDVDDDELMGEIFEAPDWIGARNAVLARIDA